MLVYTLLLWISASTVVRKESASVMPALKTTAYNSVAALHPKNLANMFVKRFAPQAPASPLLDTPSDEWYASAETGDLVLFSGTGLVPSGVTQVVTQSYWTHSGMVVRVGDTPYLFHAVPEVYDDELPSLFSEKFKEEVLRRGTTVVASSTDDGKYVEGFLQARHGGANLVRLDKYVADYVKEDAGVLVALRKLHDIDRSVFQPEIEDAAVRLTGSRFSTLLPSVIPFPFTNALGMAMNHYTKKERHHEDGDDVYCSELVLITLKRTGVVELPVVRNGKTPEWVAGGIFAGQEFNEYLKAGCDQAASLPNNHLLHDDDGAVICPRYSDTAMRLHGTGPK